MHHSSTLKWKNFDKLQMLTPNPLGSCCMFHHTMWVEKLCDLKRSDASTLQSFLTWTRRRAQTRKRLLLLRRPPIIASTGMRLSSSRAPDSFLLFLADLQLFYTRRTNHPPRCHHHLLTHRNPRSKTSFFTGLILSWDKCRCNAPTQVLIKLPITPLHKLRKYK